MITIAETLLQRKGRILLIINDIMNLFFSSIELTRRIIFLLLYTKQNEK